jgi:membrane protein DedA with SNARE-associated domain
MINDLILQAVGSPWLYLVMFALAMIDGFFPPLPSESVLVGAASAAVATGNTNLVLLCGAAAIGAIIGDNIAYAIGRWVGTERFGWMRRGRVATFLAKAKTSLAAHGAPLILAARYIPVGRVAVNTGAGALGYPRRKFVPLTVVAGITWAAYSAAIGTLAGHWLEGHPLFSALLGIVIAIAAGLVIDRATRILRERKLRRSPQAARRTGRQWPGTDAQESSAARTATRTTPIMSSPRTGPHRIAAPSGPN